ncbi:MAG: hypothetical protein IKX54_00120 [Lachnospiraceae bacterium]|nr:hypothetical protein [Lachnospiraceae bacterium]
MKLRYRILILTGVFLLSLIVFYSRVSVHTYSNERKTVAAAEASLPTVSFRVNGVEINPLLGYTFEPQAQLIHESVTPIGTDLSFTVLIDEHGGVIKRLVCSVSEVESGTEIEAREVKALKREADGRLAASVTLTGNYANNTEYTCKLTLTTNEGRDVQFYTRLMAASFGNLAKETAFALQFHADLLDKDRRTDVEKYLETRDGASGADYSHVTIEDDIDTVSYGLMEPIEMTRSVPTITEYNQTYVCATLDSRLRIFSDDADEKYRCHEKFRFRCQSKNTILFNYDRTLNAEFDGTLVSINRNQIKLGITTDNSPERLLSDNGKYLVFPYDGDMWEYDMKRNVMVKVFSFDNGSSDDMRYRNDRHSYRLISVTDEGNADFVFYGYISRGQYEGRVGILYYRYYAEEGRVEEMMFVPVTVPYEILKEEFGSLCYMNDYDEFYFTLYDTLYLYRTLVNDFTVVVEHLPSNSVLFEEEGILVYQKEYSDAINTAVDYYDLENRKADTVTTENGDRILLLGTIDGELIYGLGRAEDVTFHDNGTDHVPMYRIIIKDLDGTEVKVYNSGEELFSMAEVDDNGINVELCKKTGEAEIEHPDGTKSVRPIYTESGRYNILKSLKTPTPKITISARTSNLMHREYYINLPSGYKLEAIPKTENVLFTVLTSSTSMRVGTWIDRRYYVIAYGNVLAVSGDLSDCIKLADESAGAVYDGKGKAIWKRGIKETTKRIRNLTAYYADETRTETQAILKMIFAYKGSAVDETIYDTNEMALLDCITDGIPGTGVDLSGVTLAQALYFVSQGRPVVARYQDTWVLITGYESNRIFVVSPTRGKTLTLSLTEAKGTIGKAAVYYSYVD